jgi:nitrate/nitrite transporter NarK
VRQYAGIYGLLNVVTRPAGGYLADVLYRRFGVPGKKFLMAFCGIAQGLLSIGLGVYIDSMKHPDRTRVLFAVAPPLTPVGPVSTVIGIYVVIAVFNEGALQQEQARATQN